MLKLKSAYVTLLKCLTWEIVLSWCGELFPIPHWFSQCSSIYQCFTSYFTVQNILCRSPGTILSLDLAKESLAFFFKMQKAFSHHCLICIIILERLLLVLRLTWKRCFFFDFHFLILWQVVLGVLESTTKECCLGAVNIQIWMLCKTRIIYILWHPTPNPHHQFLFPELRHQKLLMINT